jgi:chromosome segregation ATPase
MAKGSHKVHDSDDDSDDSDSDDDDSPSYDDLVNIVKKYTSIIRRTNKQVDELELEKKNSIARGDKYENRCSELKIENENIIAKYDALNVKFKELTTSYSHLEQNFDTISNELDAKPKVEYVEKCIEKIVERAIEKVDKIDCGIQCDDLVVDPPMSNYQEANPPMKPSICVKCKGKQVIGESPNVKLSKDHQELIHENKLAMSEIQKLKRQVENLKSGYVTLTNGQDKFANMMSSTAMKYDTQGLGSYTKKIERVKTMPKVKTPPKPKVKHCTECLQEGHFAHDCKTPPPITLKDQLRPKAFNAYYGVSRTSSGKVVVRFFGAKDSTRPKQIWVPKNLVTSLKEPHVAKIASSSTSSTQTSNKVWVAKPQA